MNHMVSPQIIIASFHPIAGAYVAGNAGTNLEGLSRTCLGSVSCSDGSVFVPSQGPSPETLSFGVINLISFTLLFLPA